MPKQSKDTKTEKAFEMTNDRFKDKINTLKEVGLDARLQIFVDEECNGYKGMGSSPFRSKEGFPLLFARIMKEFQDSIRERELPEVPLDTLECMAQDFIDGHLIDEVTVALEIMTDRNIPILSCTGDCPFDDELFDGDY